MEDVPAALELEVVAVSALQDAPGLFRRDQPHPCQQIVGHGRASIRKPIERVERRQLGDAIGRIEDHRSPLRPAPATAAGADAFGAMVARPAGIAYAVGTTKVNVAVLPSAVSSTGSTSAALKIESVAFRATPGKYNCVVRAFPPGAWTLTWMCSVRPGYSPGMTVWRTNRPSASVYW